MKIVEKNVVRNEVVKKLKKESKWYHKFIIDIFAGLFYYTYRKGMLDCFKYYNK